MNTLCKAIEKIVFSGVNGIILIGPILVLLMVLWGQAKDCIRVTRKMLGEEVEDRISL